MKTKTNVAERRESEEEVSRRIKKQSEARSALEESWRLTPREIHQRVRKVRRAFETQAAQNAFYLTAQLPDSVESGRNEAYEWVDYLNPMVRGHYNLCEETLDPTTYASEDLANVHWQTAETGYWLGVIAGAILMGAPKEMVDRLERAMVEAAIFWIGKKGGKQP